MSQILESKMNDKISNWTHVPPMSQKEPKTRSVPRLHERSKPYNSNFDNTSSFSEDSFDNISGSSAYMIACQLDLWKTIAFNKTFNMQVTSLYFRKKGEIFSLGKSF